MSKSKTSAKQPNRATALFGNGRNNASDDSEEEGAATFFSKKYTPTQSAKRASYDAWLSTKRADHRSEEKRGRIAEQEAALIDRQSHETDVRLRMRALEQENQQHRFLALACHREFVKMDAVELLDKAMRSSHKLWQTKMGTKPKKKAKRDSEERLYDSDELYSPGNSDVEEVMQHKPAERRSMAESMSEDENDEDDEDDQKPIAKPGRNSKLAKNTKGLGKVDHAAASIAGASKTIDKGKGSGKGKGKKKSKDPNRQKRVMLAYNFFVQEKTATVAAEGIPPGPDRYKRLGVLWAEQKTKPEGTAKWDKLAADAKAERAAEKAAEETNALGAENDIDDDDDETMGEDGEDGDDAIDD